MSLPIPNLDDRTFEELFLEARALITRYAPQWTDHNLSDPGITLIDLFAWLAEIQIYSTNRITPEIKRKFLSLIKIVPGHAQPALAHLTLSCSSVTPLEIQAGTNVSAFDPLSDQRESFEFVESVIVSCAVLRRIIFEKNGIWKFNTVNQFSDIDTFFEPFHGSEPVQGELYLGLENGNFSDMLRIRFNLIENDLPSCIPIDNGIDLFPSVHLLWQIWNGSSWEMLTIQDKTSGLNHSGYCIVSGLLNAKPISFAKIPGHQKASETADLCWIRVIPENQTGDTYEIIPRINSILLHTVPVRHGRTFYNEKHGSSGVPCQRIAFNYSPVLYGTVSIKIDGDQWSEVVDFDESGPQDRHFVVDFNNNMLLFGDGEHGCAPSIGKDNIEILSYRTGGGTRGNVLAHHIDRFDESAYKMISVNNLNKATGGTEPETLDEALDRARRERKIPTRLISEEDVISLVSRVPGVRIHRVKVLFGYHPIFCTIPMPGTITIVVIPTSRDVNALSFPSNGTIKKILRFLNDRRLITTDVHVIKPVYIPVSVFARLRIHPHTNSQKIMEMAKEALNSYLNPIIGGPDKKGWPFGRDVFSSDILAVLQSLAGVTGVDRVSLSGPHQHHAREISVPSIGLTTPSDHSIEILTE